MIFSFFYDLIFFIFLLFCLPKILFLYFFKKKYQKSFKQRFGLDFPQINKKGKPLIWIHAVSVGETRAIILLSRLLASDYTLLISSITETGHAEAKRSLHFADFHLFLPVDLKMVIDPIVKRVRPDIVMISETDLWFQFLSSAKKYGAKTVLVNGKISEKSTKRLLFFSFFAKRLYALIDFFCVQNDLYKERFLSLGVPLNKMAVTGNLKFDEDENGWDEKDSAVWKERLGISKEDQVVVVGSTHDVEERLILDALRSLLEENPHLKIILVPRHPERFDAVAGLLSERKHSFCRFSQSKNISEQIILIDEMGLLRKCYKIADLAIVGGSFTPKIGGHNILEPLRAGVPVLFGPYMHAQPDFLKLVLDAKAGIQVTDKEIFKTVKRLLENQQARALLASHGLKLIADISGSSKKTLSICQELFSKKH